MPFRQAPSGSHQELYRYIDRLINVSHEELWYRSVIASLRCAFPMLSTRSMVVLIIQRRMVASNHRSSQVLDNKTIQLRYMDSRKSPRVEMNMRLVPSGY
jgi:hypothetical protein